jgi:hypothetical protein
MEPAEALAAIRDHLAKVEAAADLLADAGLRVSLSRGPDGSWSAGRSP